MTKYEKLSRPAVLSKPKTQKKSKSSVKPMAHLRIQPNMVSSFIASTKKPRKSRDERRANSKLKKPNADL